MQRYHPSKFKIQTNPTGCIKPVRTTSRPVPSSGPAVTFLTAFFFTVTAAPLTYRHPKLSTTIPLIFARRGALARGTSPAITALCSQAAQTSQLQPTRQSAAQQLGTGPAQRRILLSALCCPSPSVAAWVSREPSMLAKRRSISGGQWHSESGMWKGLWFDSRCQMGSMSLKLQLHTQHCVSRGSMPEFPWLVANNSLLC